MKAVTLEGINIKDSLKDVKPLDKDEIESALDFIIKKIDENLDLYTYNFPSACTTNNVYRTKGNDDWTNGFWTGMLWLAYEYTKDEKYKKVLDIHIESFEKRLEEHFVLDHHDIGFLYSLSTVAGYKVTGDDKCRDVSIKAAYKLLDRYHEDGKFIQAWGKKGDPKEYRLIIDCLLNLPLLYWAYEETKDERFKTAADTHFNTAIENIIREDGSSYHTYYFDIDTKEPTKGITHQGYSDESSWARGQAWAICGMPYNYRYSKIEESKYIYERVLNYYLNRLPEDLICYWDLVFKDEDKEPRDSSSAAIVVCGILEMNKYMDDCEEKEIYTKAAHKTLRNLIENYTSKNEENANCVLLHGVYSWQHNKGIDEGNLWGDYFYMESLMRFHKDWNLYW
ncbi:glucuronyl hydrolase [Romboutsia weinsteinii]|uniref:Glucuronyl hydrolase n=1 Tax=Romboutsia weinsteinii TaxID=2020949 RepID=A0A371J9D9_9FIRM|nr:glycoside hydrolase family 88 protein [Romboutsia weinsteinii]RDY29382.1 glucuronyl hydrolase [Romboutsia weinsteinii]